MCKPFRNRWAAALVLALIWPALLPRAAKAQTALDYGDAPSPFPTLANQNGARHTIVANVRLGQRIDAEADGQPNGQANGDDFTPAGQPSDEDGVRFLTPLIPGQTSTVEVVAFTGTANLGRLSAWIDYNGNNSWADAGEMIFTNRAVVPGTNVLAFVVPAAARLGNTYARFRFNLVGDLGFAGSTSSGEVEDYRVTIVTPLDFGDAPERPYPTLLESNGARHNVLTGFHLGTRADLELNGQPNTTATGDDTAPAGAPDDEDGVVLSSLIAGQNATATVTLTSSSGAPGRLDGWIDFDADGAWEAPLEQVFNSVTLNAGVNTLNFAVPADAATGTTYARFRLSRQGSLTPTGAAPDGEVEDYQVNVQSVTLDFGDAPQQYPTLLGNNGARHTVLAGLNLGVNVDREADGQPSGSANGDDVNPTGGPDDEDGVTFTSALVAGQTATVRVAVTFVGGAASPRLYAWVDFNGNGSWADAGEQIFNGLVVNNGTNNLSFAVPVTATAGNTFARFRVTTATSLSFDGPAPNGEVEDHPVSIQVPPLDFGDAPTNYPTLLAQNGARHVIGETIGLGAIIDQELNGQPNATATGDDIVSPVSLDDEDGVRFLTPLVAGNVATVEVVAEASALIPALLYAWIDFDGNGSWADAGEQIFAAQVVNSGTNVLNFSVPASAREGQTFARFRITTETGLSFAGLAQNGEVEDYQVSIQAGLDFGDAPDSYQTLLASDGPRHVPSRTLMLGNVIDGEGDGQPSAQANGDDANPPDAADDEDGVQLSALRPGQSASATVTVTMAAGQAARLDAWIDFNRDGDFSDAAEQIFTGVPVVPGVNTLAFTVPANAQEGPTFARFRLSRQGGLKPSGPAPDGEVEDYSPRITAPPVDECNTTCKGTDFWLAFPANYAPDPDNPLRLTLCILGPQGTTGTVDFQGRGLPISFTIGASMSAQVSLPASLDLGDAIDVVTNKGIHVTASAPVSVYAESHARYTTDGYLALPSTVLGRAYVVQGFGNVHDDAFDLAGSQFAIVACETNTRVLILPSVAAAGRAAGAVYEINLDAGQTYQLRTTNGAPADLSGTLIVADKPIGVFGSHRCAQIPSSNVFFCDYIVEQLLPVTTWGQNFVTLPLATRVNGDTFRIFAAALDTKVFVNGVQVADIDAGQFHQLTLTAGAHITADKPVGVMQYANSADFDPQPFDQGDPFMVIVPPTTMYSTNHMICTAPEDFTAHYLNIVAPAAAVGGVRVDGVIVPAAQFSPIAASGYSGARVAIAAGVHQVTAPLPVSVTVYGWAEYDSYGWPGCLFFGDTTPPTLTCPPAEDTIVIQPGTAAACAALVPDYRDKTRAEDNCSSANGIRIEQSPAPGTPIGGGVHEVRITATDARGNVATCIVTLTVIDPSDPTIQCPQRVVVPCRNPDGEKVTYSVTGRTTCGTPLPVVCDPPPGSLFPPGDTLVTCVTTNALGKMARCEFVVTVRCLKIEPGANGGWNITWTGGGTLETTSQVNGRWTPLANARSPFRLDPSGRQQFFRVRYDD